MATKNNFPVKASKSTVKPQPVSKKTAKTVKPLAKKGIKAVPAKKTAPKKKLPLVIAKKAVKPIAKSAPKKGIVKQILKKAVPKPLPKKATHASKSVKPLPKVIAKKAIPVKKAAKPIEIQPTKKVAVKNIPVKVINPAQKIMAKKDENKTPAAITANEIAAAKVTADIKAKDIKVPTPKPVIIPKIATKTVRKYQPEFTKSVLDKAQRDPGAPSQRYSDGELQEFRELIQRKLEAAKKELSYLHGLITRKDEMGGDEGDNRYMTMEDGSLSMEREQLSQMASRQITFIDHLEKAVMRIENKTYGICRVTGKLIDKARLRAVPHATLSIEAKMGSGK
ncbi:MAG: TraR/DksA C4-type zinc finger protein [Ferruginibacter sp.]